jgi:membrane protease subunit (stomatin/prohibitin family)
MVFGGKSGDIPTKGGSAFGSTTFEWEDQFKQGNIMWKVPRLIRLNDNAVVREDETAVFFRDGKAIWYIDKPGRYALTDLNAPIVGGLVKVLTGIQQQAYVYYLQRRILDGKFGSKEPYAFRDKDFDIVLLRLFGEMRYRISDPSVFVNQFIGTFNAETSADVESRIRDQVVLLIYTVLGKMKDQGISVLDLPSNLMNIEEAVLASAKGAFDQYGVEINKISGLSISLPEEVQKAVDTRSSMKVVGANYLQFQAGRAMEDAAKNPGGTAGAGIGLGMGIGAGGGMAYPMASNIMQGMSQPQQPSEKKTKKCPKCQADVDENARFCPSCGFDFSSIGLMKCPYCGKDIPKNSKFCPECGRSLVTKCPKCGTEIPAGAKFCPNCGEKVN